MKNNTLFFLTGIIFLLLCGALSLATMPQGLGTIAPRLFTGLLGGFAGFLLAMALFER